MKEIDVQIILVSGRLKTARTLNIMPRHWLLVAVLFTALVLSTSAAFSWLSLHLRLPVVQEILLSLQQRESQKTQEIVQNNLQFMATRLGELQAQVLQLNTLGDRLSSLAGFKKDPKAQAGPSQPQPQPQIQAGQGGPLIPAPLSEATLQKEIDKLALLVDSKTEELRLLESMLLEKRVKERLLPTTLPVKEAVIGSGFGYRADPFTGFRAMHEGIDFNAETGTPVVAAAAGVVVTAEWHHEYGNMVDVDHGEGLVSRYAHLSRLDVKSGQLVKRGELLGAVGSTGRSTGAHLHFEVRMLDTPQNPSTFLRQSTEYAQLPSRHGYR